MEAKNTPQDDVQRAYQTLGLTSGASIKEIFEAREDLLALWDPERLADHPRLRARAPEQIREINAAYNTLMERLGHVTAGRPRMTSEGASSAERPAGQGPGPQLTKPARLSTSLFEEVFSEPALKRSLRIPVWAIVALVMAVPLVLYLAQPAEESGEVQPQSEESLPAPAAPVEETLTSAKPSPAEEAEPESSAVAAEQKVKQESEAAPMTRTAPPTGARKKSHEPSATRPKPVLVREEAAPAAPAPSVAPPEKIDTPSATASEAYRMLLEKSGAAESLVRGEYAGYRFSEWKAIEERASDILIDLSASRAGEGSPVHFVWSVNTKDGRVRPLSQAARDLETDFKKR